MTSWVGVASLTSISAFGGGGVGGIVAQARLNEDCTKAALNPESTSMKQLMWITSSAGRFVTPLIKEKNLFYLFIYFF